MLIHQLRVVGVQGEALSVQLRSDFSSTVLLIVSTEDRILQPLVERVSAIRRDGQSLGVDCTTHLQFRINLRRKTCRLVIGMTTFMHQNDFHSFGRIGHTSTGNALGKQVCIEADRVSVVEHQAKMPITCVDQDLGEDATQDALSLGDSHFQDGLLGFRCRTESGIRVFLTQSNVLIDRGLFIQGGSGHPSGFHWISFDLGLSLSFFTTLNRIRSDLGTVDFKNRRGSRSGGSGSLGLLVLDAGNGIRQQHTGSQRHFQFRVGRGHGIGDLAKRVGFTFNGPNHTHRLRCIGVHPNLVSRLTKLARSQTSLVMHTRLTGVNTFIEVLCHSPDFVVHVSDELHEVFQSHLGLLRPTHTHGTQDLIGVRQSRIVILLASLFLSEDVLAHDERNAIQTHVVAGGMCILHSLQQTFGHLQSTQLLRRDVEQTRFSMLEDFLGHLQVATIRGNLGHHQVVLDSFLTFRRCQSSFTQINGLRGWHFGH